MFGAFDQLNALQSGIESHQEFVEWSIVQQLVCSNVNRFQTEIFSYKGKLATLAHFEKKTLQEVVPTILIQMRDLYFNDQTSAQALLNLIADKNLKAIVMMIYQILANYLLVGIPNQHCFVKSLIVAEHKQHKKRSKSRSKTPTKNNNNFSKLNQTQTIRVSNHASPFSSFLNQTQPLNQHHDRSNSNLSHSSPFASQNLKHNLDSSSNSPVPHFGCTARTPQSKSRSQSNNKSSRNNSKNFREAACKKTIMPNVFVPKGRPSVSPVACKKQEKKPQQVILNDTFQPLQDSIQHEKLVNESPRNISLSPRQMRHAIHQGRAHIHELISEKMQEIETNLGLL